MESLKDKAEVIEIKSNYIQRLEEVNFTNDVKEAILKDIENMKKLEHVVINAVRYPKGNNINHIHKIIEELSKYKNSKFKVFGDYKND